MAMVKRLARLFTIKTRTEAWLVTWAIALGAIERGRHYLDLYPGWGGKLLFLACTGVVFLAGGKLLDSVREPAPARRERPYAPPLRRSRAVNHSRRTSFRPGGGRASPASLRKD